MRDAINGDTPRPLEDIRVVDFGHVWAGPYCAATLADMGAEVVKIESGRRLDVHRRQGPYPEGQAGANRSGVWNAQNRNKKSVTIDLTTADGLEQALRLAAASDVVVENFSPGVMRRLGLDYESLCRTKPDIIMVSLSACGQQGPQSHYVGYGPALDAWSGLCSLTTYPGEAPMALGGVFPDTGSALHAAFAVLRALRERERTGRGCYIDVSELEVSLLLLSDLFLQFQDQEVPVDWVGNNDPYNVPQAAYQCRGDDRWIVISVVDEAAWQGLCQALQRADWAADPQLRSAEGRRARLGEIDIEIRRWTGVRDARDAFHELQAYGVPAGIAKTVPDLLGDPHLNERGFFVEVEHGEVGHQTVYGPIWCIDGQRPPMQAAPLLGADNEEILEMIDASDVRTTT